VSIARSQLSRVGGRNATNSSGARGFSHFVLALRCGAFASRWAANDCILSSPRGSRFLATLFTHFVNCRLRTRREIPDESRMPTHKMAIPFVAYCPRCRTKSARQDAERQRPPRKRRASSGYSLAAKSQSLRFNCQRPTYSDDCRRRIFKRASRAAEEKASRPRRKGLPHTPTGCLSTRSMLPDSGQM